MDTPPTVFADRYEIVREIAHGGMADVYLANDSKLSRPVALKVLSPELSRDPMFVERFRREAQSAAGLNQPNIVGIFDWGQEHGTSFIVMEYIDGRTLSDMIRADGVIAPAQIADIGADIAAALAFAHKNGVVHRDVKPGNVLITTAGQVKVTDFGIARAGSGSDNLTRTGAVMGTATYFSPEQAQGLPVDGRSDVYSLGIVLYEMATGAPPFGGDSPVSVAYKHVREEVPPPRLQVPTIPTELERVILTCLAKDPQDRYQSADDLRADLMRFRRGQAVIGTAVTAVVTSIPDTTQVTSAGTADRTAVVPPVPPVDPSTAKDGKSRKGPVIAVIAALIVLIGVIGYLLVTQLGNDSSGATVPVTNVVGAEVGAARTLLEAQGFQVDIVRRPNDTVAPGIVVRQDPAGGTKLEKGETILLTVSDGAGTAKVPNVEGDTFEDAQAQIEARGLKVERHEEASDTVAPGLVTRTDPGAGVRVDKGTTTVAVYVSAGPAPVNVPNVEGQDQVEATQTLNSAGFRVRKETQPSSTVAAGDVISTTPAAGNPAPRGSTVTINVSTGPETATVPNVVGDTQSSATDELTNAGFDVTVVSVLVHRREQRPGDHPEPDRAERVRTRDRRSSSPSAPARPEPPARRDPADPGSDRAGSVEAVATRKADSAAKPSRLERWYVDHGRHDLAWRHTRDRWAILVSEVMLQQTQVPRVADVWPAFMAEFPTPAAMAAAGPGAVITAWGRLGYPRRARRLWEAATVIADQGWPRGPARASGRRALHRGGGARPGRGRGRPGGRGQHPAGRRALRRSGAHTHRSRGCDGHVSPDHFAVGTGCSR